MRNIAAKLLAVGAMVMLVGGVAQAEKNGKDECGPGCEAPCCSSDVLSQKAKNIDGEEVALANAYLGDVLLIVNVASECGYTKQYKGLQKLHEKYADKGLRVLGFPCNQFGNQEPGDEEEIKEFCESNYGVEFDMFSKIKVNGEDAHPLYKYLTSDDLPVEPKGEIKWNFEKFLVGRDGEVLTRFRSAVKPGSEQMTKAIEKALAEEGPTS